MRLAVLGVLALLVTVVSGVTSAPASVVTCGAPSVVVTPMHSPDGTTRPFYAEFKNGSTAHSGYVGYELAGASGVLGSDVWIRLSGFAGGSIGVAANQSASIPARATSGSGKPLVYAYLTASAETTTAQSWTVEVWNGKPDQAGSSQVCSATDGFSKVLDVIDAAANKITSISVSSSSPSIGGGFDVTAVGDTGTMGAGDSADQSGGKGVFSMAPSMDDAWPADAFALTGVSVSIGGSSSRDRLRLYPGTAAAGAYTAVYTFTVRKASSGATPMYPVQNIASGTQVKYTGTYPSPIATIAQPTVTTTLVKSTQSMTGPPYAVTYEVVASNTAASPVVLDYLRDTPTSSSPWSFAAGSARLDGSSIADPVSDAGTLVFRGPFTVPAASGATPGKLTFTYTLNVDGSVSNSAVGQVGDVLLGSAGGGSANQVTVDPARVSVATSSLPDATAGSSYSASLIATGGAPPYTWSIASGSLPAGISLDAATGALSGTPTTAGTAAFTVTATDSASSSGSGALTITVGAAAPGDTTAPTGSIVIDGGAAVTTSQAVTLRLTAGDAVGVARYRVAEGSSCSAASWADVTPATSLDATTPLVLSGGEGSKTVCAQFADGAGNVSTTSTATITFDMPPTVVLATTAGGPTNAAFHVTATFSKAVTGFDASDVAVGNGTVSAFGGSGASYSFDVDPTGEGAVTLDVAASAAADAAGVDNIAASQLRRTYDSVRPSLVLSSGAPDPTSGGSVSVTATFSEAVDGFALGDVVVTNGSASNLAGSGTTYTFDVVPAADGTLVVAVGADAAADAAGNTSTAPTSLIRTVDRDGPTASLSSAASNPVNGSFGVSIAFSEPVTGFALGDLTITNGVASKLTGAGSSYSVDVMPSSDGEVRVGLDAGAAFDAAANPSAAATPLVRTADLFAPSVVLLSSASDPVRGTFSVTATFSEPVVGFALADVGVVNGAASHLRGSSASYTFEITPGAQGVVTVEVAAGAAVDAGGNATAAATPLVRRFAPVAPPVTIDEEPPATTSEDVPGVEITLRPPATSQPDAFLSWVGEPGAAVSCSLDGRLVEPCAAPLFLPNLAAGAHTFTLVVSSPSGGTRSSVVTWTVARGGTRPPANVKIIPKIDPKDMLGRPAPFRQSVDAARSAGPFTRLLNVRLRIPTPPGVGSNVVYVSNAPDFRDEKVFPIASDELYDWTLLAGPSGGRIVYIRFSRDADAAVGRGEIVLDQELPLLTPRFLRIGPTARSAAGRRAARVPACGGAARRWLHIGGTDGFSGLNAVQVASDPQRPCGWRPFLPTFSYRLPGRVVYVRVADRVGNISPWYRVRTRR